jgi:hypothetical protein
MREFEINGKKFIVNESSYKNVIAFKKAVFALTEKIKLDLTVLLTCGTVEQWGKFLMELDTDEDCHKAIMACLGNCRYEDKPVIEEQLFEDKELRDNYYKIIMEVFEENLRPFLLSLASLLLGESEEQAKKMTDSEQR